MRRSLYVIVLSLLDWNLVLPVAVMGTAVAAVIFLVVGVVADSYTELTD